MLLAGPPMPDRSRVMIRTKKGYPGPPGWGFGVGPTTPHSKNLLLRKLNKGKRRIFFDRPEPTAACSASGGKRRKISVALLTAPSDICQLDKAFVFSKVYHVVTDSSDCTKNMTGRLEGNCSSKLSSESPEKISKQAFSFIGRNSRF
jgi:hypothetical protein